jgi:hypothetical protein
MSNDEVWIRAFFLSLSDFNVSYTLELSTKERRVAP